MTMNTKQLGEVLNTMLTHGLTSAPVVGRVLGRQFFVANASFALPLVKSNALCFPTLVPSTRANATKFIGLELNSAFYPSIKQAREDAFKVALLNEWCNSNAGDRDIVISAAHLGDGNRYMHVQRAYFGRISASGRPEPVSRGGMPALIVDCE